jgi:hypothetical protein
VILSSIRRSIFLDLPGSFFPCSPAIIWVGPPVCDHQNGISQLSAQPLGREEERLSTPRLLYAGVAAASAETEV